MNTRLAFDHPMVEPKSLSLYEVDAMLRQIETAFFGVKLECRLTPI